MTTWTAEEEAAHLAKRFEGINQAAFARAHKVPGGSSMLSQHIKGRRPISFEAALAYCRGFQVPLEQVSPRLAKLAKEAIGASSSASGNLSVREPTAPFRVVMDTSALLEQFGMLLASVPADSREPVGALLDRWAQAGGADRFRTALSAVIGAAASGKRRAPRA